MTYRHDKAGTKKDKERIRKALMFKDAKKIKPNWYMSHKPYGGKYKAEENKNE